MFSRASSNAVLTPTIAGGAVNRACRIVHGAHMMSRRGPAALYAAALSSVAAAYPIGTAGVKWGAVEKDAWRQSRSIVRSYQDEVLAKVKALDDGRFVVQQYGALTQDKERYPLYSVRSKEWSPSKPCVLITGGVHGYETSGVQGALLFLASEAEAYSETFNILVAPCVSPWGYETIQRWNAQAVDPNRSFNPDGEVVAGRSFNPEAATEESAALIAHLGTLGVEQWMCHIDLHETTDTDESEFRPAKAARDGEDYTPGLIPDGFYLVADSTNPQTAWHKAMIDAVSEVTHIAPPDENGQIIEEDVLQHGVIGIPPPSAIGLCAGVTNAAYATTTEVYPDSPKATPEQCNRAQVKTITAGLDFIIEAEGLKRAADKAEL